MEAMQDHYLSGSGYDSTVTSNKPWADGRLSQHGVIVYCCVAMHAQASSGESGASIRAIARECRMGTETVQFAMRELRALGYVEKIGGGPRQAARYRVNAEPATPIPYAALIDTVPIEQRGPITELDAREATG